MIEKKGNQEEIKILIAEDELIVAEDLAVTLQDLGYQVAEMASTGELAIQLAQESKPALVLMDVKLAGGIDGIEASEQIRTRFDIPVIFLTAYDEKDVLQRAKQTEPYGYLAKPFSHHILKITIETALYKHAADKRVRESEERFRKVFDQGPIGMGLVGTDGRFLVVNSQLFQMLGYTEDELTRLTFVDITHPDHVTQDLEAVRSLYAGEIPYYKAEKRYIKKNGDILWGNLTAAAIRDAEGKLLYTLPMVEDITDRKRAEEALRESEEKYRLFVETANEAVFVAQDGVLRFANRRCMELTGYPEAELLSKPMIDFIDPDDRELVVQYHQRRLRGDDAPDTYSFRIIDKDGDIKWLELKSALITWAGSPAVLCFASDITDRKEAEEALRETEERFRLAFENANIGVCLVDTQGRLIRVNNQMCEIFGYSRSELETMTVNDIAHPEDLELSPRFIERARSGEVSRAEFEKRYIHKRGHVVWGRVSSSLVRDKEGNPLYFISHVQDTTDRKRSQEALERSEANYRAMFDSMNDAVFVHDAETGAILDVNRKMCEMYGYTRDEAVLLNVETLSLGEPPYTQSEALRWVRKAVEERPQLFEWIGKDKTGRCLWVEVNLKSALIGGVGRILAVVRDISDRKKAEQELRESEKKYRTILENIADGYHEVDLVGNLTLVNDSMCEILGYPREELLGMNYRSLMDEPAAKSVFQAYNEVYRTGMSNPGFSYQNIRKDGSRRDVSVSISLIKDADGQPQGFRGIMRDVTERKSLQEQLYQATKMEALGTLAGGIAHDFNNLLQIILGYSDLLLLRKKKDDPDYDKLSAMLGAARRGTDLVQQILTFSRKVETKRRPLDLNHEIRQIDDLLRRTIERMISIEVDLKDDLWTISADPVQIEQILINLAVNAKHAMPEGGRLVIETKNIKLDEAYCRTHLETKPGRYVLLMVSDTGHGMDKEVVERIFEPFFTTKETGEGTGLGLATVFGIVKSHGGAITCYSEPGVGTTFKMHFPAIEGELEWSAEITQGMPALGTETLLVVDDEESIRELAKDLLNGFGYKVLTASTGREAVDIYSKGQEVISLVILDLIMPEMDGSKCLQELLQINPLVKVLVASGYSANGPAREAATIGAKGYVGKPYNVRELLRMVRAVLDAA